MINSQFLAKRALKLREIFPSFDVANVGERREVFWHRVFLDGDEENKYNIMRKSSESKELDERAFPFDKYFGFPLKPYLQNKNILDLGCFTGGRTAAWYDSYGLKRASGIDVEEVFIEAATNYARLKKIECDFRLGYGEEIPYEDSEFDAVLTFDVLEHVVDVEKTLHECRRVLKPGGKAFVVFPTYFQPNEHHLGMVTGVPGLQLLFDGGALVHAYYEIIEERGQDAYWYRRSSPVLAKHERCHTINGMSFRRFQSIVKRQGWKVEYIARAPIGTIGRTSDKHGLRRRLMSLTRPFTFLPGLQEIFLHRVTMILEVRK